MRLLLLPALLLAAAPVAAQGKFPPDSFTNLKVLPKNISPRELLTTMRGFALGLGVRCTYCHVGKEGQPLDSVNFKSDDKRTKRVARVMIEMVNHINEEHLADVPDRPEPHVVVRCETCHRGVSRPRLLDDEMQLYLADSGLTAALQHYRDLRAKYYGGEAYDFRELPLISLAQGEARANRPDNAIAILALSAEFFPTSGQTPMTLGNILLFKGDTAKAIAAFRDAVAKDSTLMPARMQLQRLTGGKH
ncbi:MAG TPA: c-type cytochrome [Gemmatimonadales bacterium]|nr:c-type cytochrome [Gemmatimonadales bacterium]